MNLFTGPLGGFLSSQTVYIPDQLQRAIGSAITQQLAGLEPGNRKEENTIEGDSSPPDTAARPEKGKGESEESKEHERPGKSIVFLHVADLHLGLSPPLIGGGTSMATPHLAMVAGQLLSSNRHSRRNLTTEEIFAALLETVKSPGFIVVAGNHDPERPREGPAREFRPDEAERHFRGLGNWKHPETGRAARDYWFGAGAQGVEWLVRRLRSETHVEALHDAAALLTDLGRASVGPIIEELDRDPAADQALALLRALGWLGESHERPTLEGAQGELILADLLQHDDPDIREAAACAMRLLRPERAAHWLTRRGRVEPDAAVRAAIEDELGRYHIGRTLADVGPESRPQGRLGVGPRCLGPQSGGRGR